MSIYEEYLREGFAEDGSLASVDIVYPDDFNFAWDVVDRIAAATPGKRALVWCNTEGEEHVFSFDDISRGSRRVAKVFISSGIGRGDKVMVTLKKHYEYWFVAMALCRIGAVMIPMTHMLTADDLAYRFAATEVKAVVSTSDDFVPEAFEKALEISGARPVLWTVRNNREGWRNLTLEARSAGEDLPRMDTLASDPMLLYFTSGTTGYPKGVIHDNSYPLAHIVTAKCWQGAYDGGLHFTVAETGWAKASWGKLYGQWLVGSAVMVFDFDTFDPKQLVTIINRHQVTSFCAPPTIYRYLMRKDLPSMPSLKHASTAGEYLSPDIFQKFLERTGLALHEGYGQTETALVAGVFLGQTAVDGSMGRPSPQYDVKLVDSEGNDTPQGEVGEFVIMKRDGRRPVGIFSAYLGDEERYEQVWRGGVYHTGDSAWMDEEGALWFNGRFDDIIKSGGYRIGPYEIENVLVTHPAVFECSVVGVPDARRGQAIKAFVRLKEGFSPSRELEKEIREFTNSRLAEYKWLRQLEFVDALPKTISGKTRKLDLRKQD